MSKILLFENRRLRPRAGAAVEPAGNIHASGNYRKALIGVMVERAQRCGSCPAKVEAGLAKRTCSIKMRERVSDSVKT